MTVELLRYLFGYYRVYLDTRLGAVAAEKLGQGAMERPATSLRDEDVWSHPCLSG